MKIIIDWCNDNYGFIAAILSIVGTVLSFITIVVSIRAARLPFKKGLKLSSYHNLAQIPNPSIQKPKISLIGISIETVNVGFRNINITFLGFGFKDKKSKNKYKKIVNTQDNQAYLGVIKPTEITSNLYDTTSLLAALEQLPLNTKLYLIAQDSEGKIYSKRSGKVKTYVNFIRKCLETEENMYGLQ